MTITTLTTENKPTDLIMNDIRVVLMDVDTMVGESIFKNADGSYTVLLNSSWSAEEQHRCFEHALSHIRHNDWEKFDVNEIERERHESWTLRKGFDRPTSS